MSQTEKIEARARYRALFDAVSLAINAADPAGLLAVGALSDEYATEIANILPRVAAAGTLDDVVDIVHGEFSRWFDADTAGPRHAYRATAERIWEAVHTYRSANLKT